jgi:hypothetical protein
MSKMLSEKLKELRVVNGFKFRYHKLLSGGIRRWACTRKSCPAHIKIDVEGNTVESVLNHNHEPDTNKDLVRQQVSNKLKRKATEDICEKPSKLIHSELRREGISDLSLQDLEKIRKNMYEARTAILPPLPTTLEELHAVLNTYKRLMTNN